MKPTWRGAAVAWAVAALSVSGGVERPKLVAPAPDVAKVTWKKMGDATGYGVELFRIDGRCGTDVSDYSGLPDAWPKGWTHYSYDTSCYSDPRVPKMNYPKSWLATGAYPDAVTRVVGKFESRKKSQFEDVAKTFIRVETSVTENGDDWVKLEDRYQVTTSVRHFTNTFDFAEGVRRLRFSVEYAGDNPEYSNVGIAFGKLTVDYGCEVRTSVKHAETDGSGRAVSFGGLDGAARYLAVVTPSGGGQLKPVESAVLDYSSLHFRSEAPLPIGDLPGWTYSQDFAGLSSVRSDLPSAQVPLDGWSWSSSKGDVPEVIHMTARTNATAGGVYVYSDAEHTPGSCQFGTLASGETGYQLSVAFVNGSKETISRSTVSFDASLWAERKNPADYETSYRVADGSWMPFENGVPFWIRPALRPGETISVRWIHPKTTSGPMLALDNVKVEFVRPRKFLLLVR